MRIPLLSTSVILLLSFLVQAWADHPACLRTAISKLIKQTEQSVDPTKTANFASGERAYAYEVEIAQKTGLEVEEVMGITRNFADELVVDGSTGVFRIGNELEIDPSLNLVNAYRNGMQTIKPGELKFEDLIDLRKFTNEIFSTHQGRQLVSPKLRFKNANETATVQKPHPEVLKRIESYGHEIRSIKPGKNGGDTIITYTGNPRRAVETYLERLNFMIKNRYPPEYITAYAVQELLIIHPFSGGNGRVARMLGQILYKKLTGKTMYFPKHFHKELAYSLTTLAKTIMPPISKMGITASSVSDASRTIYINMNLLPETRIVGPANIKITDSGFFDTFTHSNKTYQYSSLPAEVKMTGRTEFIYYGRPAQSLEDAEKKVDLLFQYGRQTRVSNPHRDITRHMNSTNDDPSGFFSATTDYEAARYFVRPKNFSNTFKGYGIVYIIDPKDAELLSIEDFVRHVRQKVEMFENEVIFSKNLNPRRIVGAIIYNNATYKPEKYYLNPNYVPKP